MLFKRGLVALGLTMALVWAQNSLAHGLFWASGATRDTLMVGHSSATAHGDQKAKPCSDQMARSVRVLQPESNEWQILPSPDKPLVLTPTRCAASWVVIDWGWWVKTAQGTRQAHPDSIVGVLQAWHSVETLRYLKTDHQAACALFHQDLEILPASNPLHLKPGKKLELTVFNEGQPVAGVPVSYNGSVRGETDSKGHIRIKLRTWGPQTFRATLREPIAGRSHTEKVSTASICFTLEEK